MAEVGDGGDENTETPRSKELTPSPEEPASLKDEEEEEEEENEGEEEEENCVSDMKPSSSLQLMLTCIAEERRKDGIHHRLITDGASSYFITELLVIYLKIHIFVCNICLVKHNV